MPGVGRVVGRVVGISDFGFGRGGVPIGVDGAVGFEGFGLVVGNSDFGFVGVTGGNVPGVDVRCAKSTLLLKPKKPRKNTIFFIMICF